MHNNILKENSSPSPCLQSIIYTAQKLTHGEISMHDSIAKVNPKCVAVMCNTGYWMEILSKCGVNWLPPIYCGNNDFYANQLHHLFSVTRCK